MLQGECLDTDLCKSGKCGHICILDWCIDLAFQKPNKTSLMASFSLLVEYNIGYSAGLWLVPESYSYAASRHNNHMVEARISVTAANSFICHSKRLQFFEYSILLCKSMQQNIFS